MTRDLAVVGSRDFPKLTLIEMFIQALPGDTRIISGGARGVDRVAAAAARARGLEVHECLPDESIASPQRFLIRNTEIADMATRAVIFWDGRSSGTRDTAKKFSKRGKLVVTIRPDFATSFTVEVALWIWDDVHLRQMGLVR